MSYDQLYRMFEEGELDLSFMYDLETEEEALRMFDKQLDEDTVFLDVGSHKGIYSCMALLNGATVIAAEPSTKPLESLRANLDEIGGEYTIIPRPVSSEEQEIKMAIDTAVGTGSATTDSPKFNKKEGHKKVKEFTSVGLPDLIREHNPDIMKIDVEGSEVELLNSLPDDEYPSIVYCELHWDQKEEASNLLNKAGNFEVIDKRENTWHTVTFEGENSHMP